jgi:hypothetical protein
MTHAVTNIKTMTDNQTRTKGYKAVAKNESVGSKRFRCSLMVDDVNIIPLDCGGGLKQCDCVLPAFSCC